MTNYMVDSEYLAKPWCPACEPERDPTVEILETRYCGTHGPTVGGELDGEIVSTGYMSGSAEVGGPDNTLWCNAIHRGIWPAKQHMVPDIVDNSLNILVD